MGTKLLVGTAEGLVEVADGSRALLSGHDVSAIAGDGDDWWAVVDRYEVWRSKPGDAWGCVARVPDAKATCLLPTASGLLVGTEESHLYRLGDGSLERLESFENAEGREQWDTPWGAPPDVRSMSRSSDAVYVNIHVGGILRSAGLDGLWQPTIDKDKDVHQVLVHQGSGLLLAAAAYGLAVSEDGGASWKMHTEGVHGHYMRAVAVAGEHVLVTASTGPFTEEAAVYRKALSNGQPFERCETGLPKVFNHNIDTFCLDAKSSEAAFGAYGTVFVSADEGETWEATAEGLPEIRAVAFA